MALRWRRARGGRRLCVAAIGAALAAVVLLCAFTAAASPPPACRHDAEDPPNPALATLCCPGRWAPTAQTPCPPPTSIVGWYGRTGNNFAQLVGAVAVANHTGAVVVAPPHPLLAPGSGGAASRVFDFRSPECVARQGAVVLDDEDATKPVSPAFHFEKGGSAPPAVAASLWFYRSSCAAAGLDALPASARRAAAVSLVIPRIPALAEAAAAAADAPPSLTIHLRGGDVFALAAGGGARFYGQPPLAFYRRVLVEEGYLAAKTPITILHEDELNPVVGGLRAFLEREGAARRTTWVRGGGAPAAAAALVRSTHLIAAESSLSLGFGVGAAPHLARAFIPSCRRPHALAVLYDDGPKKGVPASSLADLRHKGGGSDPGVPGKCYEFPGFTPFGEWTGTEAQRAALLEYEDADVEAFELPAGGGVRPDGERSV